MENELRLTIAAIVLAAFNISHAAERVGDYEYAINNGTVTLTMYFGADLALTIPNMIEGLPVTGIGGGGGQGFIINARQSMTSVTIPDSVTSIGDGAFEYCQSLTRVVIGNGVTRIGDLAFASCFSLTSVTIPESVTSIGDGVFQYCFSLRAIAVDPLNPIYSSVDGVLLDKNQSTLILCPTGRTGSYIIPDSVTGIRDRAFDNCYNLTSVTIPDSVTSIGDRTFQLCENLTSITIPDSVTSIGEGTFQYCQNLTSVAIGKGVTSFGEGTFHYCFSLRTIGVNLLNPIYSSVDGVLFDKNQSTLILCPAGRTESYTIPDSVTGIRDGAFYYCKNLTSVTIPDSVTSIGDRTFQLCENLTSITIPDSVTSIGDRAFCACVSLISITIPDSVTSIGEGAFQDCKNLTSVTIPDSVTAIRDWVFWGCASLTNVAIGDSVTNIASGTFSYCDGLRTIAVDPLNPIYSSVDGVLFDKNQSTLIKCPMGRSGSYTIPDSVTTIGDGAFQYCESLTSVTIPDSVMTIGQQAFSGCALTNVTIPDSVIIIAAEAFSACSSLTSVSIGKGVTTIGQQAFSGCALTSVTIPDSVTNIASRAFSQCGLRTIAVDPLNPIYIIVDGVLFDKNQSTLILCPEGRTGSYTIPNSVTGIGDGAFYYCENLTSVTIPDSVTSIGAEAFSACFRLTSVTIGTGVTSIGDGAFSQPQFAQGQVRVYALAGVYFRGDAPALGFDVFDHPIIRPPWITHPNLTLYHLPGTTGWAATFDDLPTALWIPVMPNLPSVTADNPLRLVTHSPAPATVRVQRSANLVDWEDWQTVSKDSGPSGLQDTEAGSTPYRFYRGIEE